jgi:hypothetical protein
MDWFERTERFDDYLDEIEGDIVIGGIPYPYGETWRQVDRIAWEQAMLDWEDANGFDDESAGD